MQNALNVEDINRLLNERTAEAQSDAVSKIARCFSKEIFSPRERAIAEDIFRMLVEKADREVRQSLSINLKSAIDLPHDIAMRLAKDVDSVALPLIRSSEVLSDEDLIELIKQNSEAKQIAIAGRDRVSEVVSDALIDTGNERVVGHVVANEGAQISDRGYNRVMMEHRDSEAVSAALSRRSDLPAAIAAKVTEAVAGRLRDYLMSKQDIPIDRISNLVFQARERITANLSEDVSTSNELDDMVKQLVERSRFTPSLALRALCMGDMPLFEAGMAAIGGIPLENAQVLIHDRGDNGLLALYSRAGFPKRLYPAFRAAILVLSEMEMDYAPRSRSRFVRTMLERILTALEEDSELSDQDREYLLDKLYEIAA